MTPFIDKLSGYHSYNQILLFKYMIHLVKSRNYIYYYPPNGQYHGLALIVGLTDRVS